MKEVAAKNYQCEHCEKVFDNSVKCQLHELECLAEKQCRERGHVDLEHCVADGLLVEQCGRCHEVLAQVPVGLSSYGGKEEELLFEFLGEIMKLAREKYPVLVEEQP